jgi:hypothetical protein
MIPLLNQLSYAAELAAEQLSGGGESAGVPDCAATVPEKSLGNAAR